MKRSPARTQFSLVFAGSATPIVEPDSKPEAASPEPSSVRAELEQPLRISVVAAATAMVASAILRMLCLLSRRDNSVVRREPW